MAIGKVVRITIWYKDSINLYSIREHEAHSEIHIHFFFRIGNCWNDFKKFKKKFESISDAWKSTTNYIKKHNLPKKIAKINFNYFFFFPTNFHKFSFVIAQKNQLTTSHLALFVRPGLRLFRKVVGSQLEREKKPLESIARFYFFCCVRSITQTEVWTVRLTVLHWTYFTLDCLCLHLSRAARAKDAERLYFSSFFFPVLLLSLFLLCSVCVRVCVWVRSVPLFATIAICCLSFCPFDIYSTNSRSISR